MDDESSTYIRKFLTHASNLRAEPVRSVSSGGQGGTFGGEHGVYIRVLY